MLYINNTTTTQTLGIPQICPNINGRDVLEGANVLYLFLTSTVGGQTYQYEVSLDEDEFDAALKSYVMVNLTLTETIPEGEYTYKFQVGAPYINLVVAVGLAVVGDYAPSTTQYNNNTITYEQYEG